MAHNFTSAAVDELACSVCLLYYVPPYQPKNLPECSHICCILCLKDLENKSNRTVKCPQCNQISKLPPGGVEALPTILAMQNLALKHPEGIKQQKERITNDLRQHKLDKEKGLKELTEQKKQLRDSIKSEIESVEKAAEEVAQQARDLVEQIQSTAQPQLSGLQERVLQMAEEIKGIDNICTKLQEMTDGEFLSQADFLTIQMAKLHKAHTATGKSQAFKVAKFIPYEVRLGRVVRPRRLQLVRELKVDTFGKARNLAAMPNGLLVVCENAPNSQGHRPQQVIVIENKTGQYGMQAQFSVISSEIYKQIDVAVTADSKYLITKCSAGIDMYSPDGKFIKTMKTSDEKTDSKQHNNTITTCVTTTFDGRIIAGSGTGPNEKSRKWFLSVHDLDGKILKTIPISMMPLQIVNIRGTHVAVSGSKRVQDKVCVYIYDLRSGQETIKIDIPIGLSIKFCYDIQSDCILTTRCTIDSRRSCDSCTVEQYCTNTGKLVTTLARGIAPPFGITLIHDGMLAVSYADSVNIYKIA